MSSTVSKSQDVDQFREVAGNLASLIQSSPDRVTALNKFVEAVSDPEAFTDIIVAYAGRWLAETGGQSVLVGPDMFWQLSAPNGRAATSIGESAPAVENNYGERIRKMILVCVLDNLANNHRPAPGAADHRTVGHDIAEPRFAGNILMGNGLKNAVADHRLATNGTN